MDRLAPTAARTRHGHDRGRAATAARLSLRMPRPAWRHHHSLTEETGPDEVARPNWEYIRVDVRLPRHRKLDGARREVKWTIVELWAYCGEELTDGFVRDAVWKTIGTAPIRQQIIDRDLPGVFAVVI